MSRFVVGDAEAEAALGRADPRLEIATLEHRFIVRAGEGFVDLLGAALMDRVHRAAPGVQIRFPAFDISALWHPRLDHDPAHRWFRSEVLALCLAAYPHHGDTCPAKM